jgi:hypothetical protein
LQSTILKNEPALREIEFFAAWAREEKAVNPYVLPVHLLQAAHNVSGVVLIRANQNVGAKRRPQRRRHFHDSWQPQSLLAVV